LQHSLPALMTSLPISPSSPPAAHPSHPAAIPAPSGTKPFSTFLQNSDAEYDQPVKSVKASPRQATTKQELAKPETTKQEGTKPEKDEKPAKDRTAQNPALALLMPAQQQHLPLDTRALTLALPKKEQQETERPSATAAVPDDAENATGPVPGVASAIASKQQIAFGATITRSIPKSIPASLAKIGSPVQQQTQHQPQLGKTATVGDKPSSSKQQHSGSSDSDHGAASPHAAPSDIVAAKSESSAPAQFSVPATPGSAPATLVQSAYSAAPVAKTSQPEPVVRSSGITETAQTPMARPQNIELQTGDVNVRVSERAGEVQITVRTSDSDIAQSLRQHLPELSDKLTQTGVHADLWQPSAAQSATSDPGADSSPGRDSQNQQQSGTPDGGPGNQQSSEQQEQRRDDWQQQLDSAETDDR
jgi:hypothetical protein